MYILVQNGNDNSSHIQRLTFSVLIFILCQITTMYADDEAGGVGNSFKNMMEADPDFGKIENRHVKNER